MRISGDDIIGWFLFSIIAIPLAMGSLFLTFWIVKHIITDIFCI